MTAEEIIKLDTEEGGKKTGKKPSGKKK